MKAIGLVGTNGAGKSTVCDFLRQKGFSVYSLSDVLRDIIREQGGELTRDYLTDTANTLKAQEGQAVFAKKTYEKACQNKDSYVVFDSVRNVSEMEFLKEKGVYFIGIDAAIECRYERITKRKRETDFVDFETFKRQDDRENTGQSTGQHIFAALDKCDVIIENNNGQKELEDKIMNTISDLGIQCPE